MFFMGTLYLERVLTFSPLQIGFAFLPATITMGALSIGLGRQADHALRRRATS